jgi:hypothetical protein
VNIGAANDMDTFGKRILPQVIQEIRFSAYCARKLQPSRRSRIVDHRNLIASDVEPKWLKEAAEVSAEAGD